MCGWWKLKRTITLAELKAESALSEMILVRRGNRLSVMPVTEAHWEHVLSLDSAFLRTVFGLARHPAQVCREYLLGRRKPLLQGGFSG